MAQGAQRQKATLSSKGASSKGAESHEETLVSLTVRAVFTGPACCTLTARQLIDALSRDGFPLRRYSGRAAQEETAYSTDSLRPLETQEQRRDHPDRN